MKISQSIHDLANDPATFLTFLHAAVEGQLQATLAGVDDEDDIEDFLLGAERLIRIHRDGWLHVKSQAYLEHVLSIASQLEIDAYARAMVEGHARWPHL